MAVIQRWYIFYFCFRNIAKDLLFLTPSTPFYNHFVFQRIRSEFFQAIELILQILVLSFYVCICSGRDMNMPCHDGQHYKILLMDRDRKYVSEYTSVHISMSVYIWRYKIFNIVQCNHFYLFAVSQQWLSMSVSIYLYMNICASMSVGWMPINTLKYLYKIPINWIVELKSTNLFTFIAFALKLFSSFLFTPIRQMSSCFNVCLSTHYITNLSLYSLKKPVFKIFMYFLQNLSVQVLIYAMVLERHINFWLYFWWNSSKTIYTPWLFCHCVC